MNHVQLIGTLTQDGELKYLPTGAPILELQLAGTDHITREGQSLDLPWYHRVSVWGRQAEMFAELKAGDAVFVPGRLNYRAWESQDGQKRTAVDVVAEGFIEYLGRPTGVDTDARGQARMRGAVNLVTIKGNLTRDAELRYTPNGHAVLNLGLAVNDRYQKNGEWVERVHFIDATAWRGVAEANANLTKGSPVIVRGRLVNDSWEKDGQKRFATKVDASEVRAVYRVGDLGARQVKPAAKALDIDDSFSPEEDLPF